MSTLSHVNRIHMLLFYLFCTTTLYYINPPCNVLNGSLVFIVNLSGYRLSLLDELLDNPHTSSFVIKCQNSLEEPTVPCNLELQVDERT